MTLMRNEAVNILKIHVQEFSQTFLKRPLKIDKTKLLMTNGS